MAHHGALVKDIFGQEDCYYGIFHAFPDVDLSQSLQIVLSWGSHTRRDSRGFVSSHVMKFSEGGKSLGKSVRLMLGVAENQWMDFMTNATNFHLLCD